MVVFGGDANAIIVEKSMYQPLVRNQQVAGSNPASSSSIKPWNPNDFKAFVMCKFWILCTRPVRIFVSAFDIIKLC